MTTVTAPGKIILFGEHAVVYGEPAAAVAVNLRMKMSARPGDRNTVNGYPLTQRHHSYLHTAMNRFWNERTLTFDLDSSIPSSSGMGSSAALSVCTSFLLTLLKKEENQDFAGKVARILSKDPTDTSRATLEYLVAKRAFSIEYLTQGGASPIDTSASTHGDGIVIRKEKGANFLWHIDREDKNWFIHHMNVPDISLVVANTGIRSSTPLQVKKVARFVQKRKFGKEVIGEIGQLVDEGIKAIESNDPVRIGEIMDENHRLLAILGVSHPRIEKLLRALRRHSFGAKLTGAGGGGSVIAVSDRPEKLVEVLARFGITGYPLQLKQPGIAIEKEDGYDGEN